MYLDLAQIGLATELLELVASSAAAGMAMGGFVVAAAGLVRGWSREKVESRALRDAAVGGLGGIGLLLVDALARIF